MFSFPFGLLPPPDRQPRSEEKAGKIAAQKLGTRGYFFMIDFSLLRLAISFARRPFSAIHRFDILVLSFFSSRVRTSNFKVVFGAQLASSKRVCFFPQSALVTTKVSILPFVFVQSCQRWSGLTGWLWGSRDLIIFNVTFLHSQSCGTSYQNKKIHLFVIINRKQKTRG